MNDREKTPSELHRENTYAERQARIREQTKREEEAAARIRDKRLAFEEGMAERIAQAKANQEQARANFDALGELMAKTTDRKELIEIGRKRDDLAPNTGRKFVYQNHCWKCKRGVSSEIHARCEVCRWYICGNCTSCGCGYYELYGYPDKTDDRLLFNGNVDSIFLPDYPDDLS